MLPSFFIRRVPSQYASCFPSALLLLVVVFSVLVAADAVRIHVARPPRGGFIPGQMIPGQMMPNAVPDPGFTDEDLATPLSSNSLGLIPGQMMPNAQPDKGFTDSDVPPMPGLPGLAPGQTMLNHGGVDEEEDNDPLLAHIHSKLNRGELIPGQMMPRAARNNDELLAEMESGTPAPPHLGARQPRRGSHVTESVSLPMAPGLHPNKVCPQQPVTVATVKRISYQTNAMERLLESEFKKATKRKEYIKQMDAYIKARVLELNKVKHDLRQQLDWMEVTQHKVNANRQHMNLVQYNDMLTCLKKQDKSLWNAHHKEKLLLDDLSAKAAQAEMAIHAFRDKIKKKVPGVVSTVPSTRTDKARAKTSAARQKPVHAPVHAPQTPSPLIWSGGVGGARNSTNATRADPFAVLGEDKPQHKGGRQGPGTPTRPAPETGKQKGKGKV